MCAYGVRPPSTSVPARALSRRVLAVACKQEGEGEERGEWKDGRLQCEMEQKRRRRGQRQITYKAQAKLTRAEPMLSESASGMNGNCTKAARFRSTAESDVFYCHLHRDQDSVDCDHRVCEVVNCSAVARYGFSSVPKVCSSADEHGEGGSSGVRGLRDEGGAWARGPEARIRAAAGRPVADLSAGGVCNEGEGAGDGRAQHEGEKLDKAESGSGQRVIIGRRQFCRRHRTQGQVCLDYRCSYCGDYGHWRSNCAVLRSVRPAAAVAQRPQLCGGNTQRSMHGGEKMVLGGAGS